MSDDCKCDHCGNRGRRRRFRFAPEGWFYLEAKDDDDPSNTIIIWACSDRCAAAQWKPGPGPRMDAEVPS